MKCYFGFDPSINDAAWAVVNEKGGVMCGLIRNKYEKKGTKVKGWEKLDDFIDLLQAEFTRIIPTLPVIECITCEAQYCTRRGNQVHNVRLGWVAAVVYSMFYMHGPCGVYGKGIPRFIAPPATWTRNVPKEIRHMELAEKVAPIEEWMWVGEAAPPSLMHNVWDAVGLALWGKEQLINEDI